MTRLTIELPDDVYERLAAAAAEQDVTPEELAARIVTEKFPPPEPIS